MKLMLKRLTVLSLAGLLTGGSLITTGTVKAAAAPSASASSTSSTESSASDSTNDATSGKSFSYTPVYHETQDPNVQNYFKNIRTPDKNDTYNVKVTNVTGTAITLGMDVTDAITSSTGIAYGNGNATNKKKPLQIEPAYKFTKYVVSYPKTVSLAPHESKTLAVVVKVPASLSGSVLGGIHLWDAAYTKSKDNLKYKTDYVLPILLMDTTDTQKGSSVGLLKASAVRSNKNVTFGFGIQNNIAKVAGEYSWTYTLTKKGSDKVITKGKISKLVMAPKTTATIYFDVPGSKLKQGEYQINMVDSTTKKHTKSTLPVRVDYKALNQTKQNTAPAKTKADKHYIWGVPVLLIFVLIPIYLAKSNRSNDKKAK